MIKKLIIVMMIILPVRVMATGDDNVKVTNIHISSTNYSYSGNVFIEFDRIILGGCDGVYISFPNSGNNWESRMYSAFLMAKASGATLFVDYNPNDNVAADGQSDSKYCKLAKIIIH